MSRFAILSVLSICSLITGCGGEMPSKQVGEHTFWVPDRYLIHGSIPWLPPSQSDNLTFTFNPDAPLEEQIVVLVQPAEEICSPSTKPTTNELERACDLSVDSEINNADGKLKKIFLQGDDTQWHYENDSGAVVASCFAMAGEDGRGLCSSLGQYGDLIYSFGIQEKAVPRLSALRREIGKLLSEWEA